MTQEESFDEYCTVLRSYGLLTGSRTSLRFYLDYLFKGIRLEGVSVLDVGGGVGLFSLYAACMGARPVHCLEPELEGSSRSAADRLRQLCDALPPHVNIIPEAVTFQEFQPADQTFDIILLHNSINHLDEEACINLQHSADARKRYECIFRKLSELAAPKATLIIADCSRHNFWHRIGLRNPLAPTIEWHKHHSPVYWASLLGAHGFANHEIRWWSPGRLGRMGKMLLGNQLASYFTTSHFCLVMDRV